VGPDNDDPNLLEQQIFKSCQDISNEGLAEGVAPVVVVKGDDADIILGFLKY
jgi:hypothetical protein